MGRRDTLADEAGLRAGDTIHEINRQPVRSPREGVRRFCGEACRRLFTEKLRGARRRVWDTGRHGGGAGVVDEWLGDR